MRFPHLPFLLTAAITPFVLSACSGDKDASAQPDPDPDPQASTISYRVTILNISHDQPLSPVALVLHDSNYSAWAIGDSATDGLEVLAEDGDPSAFLAEASNEITTATASAGVPIFPGESVVMTLSAAETEGLKLTVASMPINTNDAFSGVTGWDISQLAVGESMKKITPIYDAGTEKNTEAVGSIPGPADGGEGFNADRDDITDQVTRHPGVVTQADGYAASALTESHSFDNGVMRVTIERTL